MISKLAFAAAVAFLFVLAPRGAGADDKADKAKTYEIKQSSEVKVAPGSEGVASLTITGKNGWHVNEEAPMTVTVAPPPPGITVKKPKQTRADLADKSKDAPRFDIAFSAAEPGKKTINAEAKFVMCQETACKPVKETVAFLIDAAPAGGAPAPKKK